MNRSTKIRICHRGALVDRPRVVYVDNDAIVTSHNRALLADRDGVTVLHGDIRCPARIFKQDELWDTIDFGQQGVVLFVAVLHFIPPEDDPESTVGPFCSYLVPARFLAISHITSAG